MRITGRMGAIVVLLLGAVSLAAPVADTNPDWPGWRGANRDGKSPDQGLLKEWPAGGPKLLWQAGDLGKGFSSVAVSGGMVYITGDKGGKLVLFAFDLNGKLQWKAENGDACHNKPDGCRATPTLDGGKVYLLSSNGRLGCFDAKTGKELWSREAKDFGGSPGGWGYAESVLIHENLAIFKPGGKNCIVALDKVTGKTVWTSPGNGGGPEYGSCLFFEFDKKPMIVTGNGKGLVCVDAKTGSVLWTNGFSAGNTANCPTPAYADGYVFWANGYGKGGVCMKLLPDGKAQQAWTTRDMVCHHGGYIIDNGYIYGDTGKGVACLELKTGKKMWADPAVGKGSLCYADGMLYLFGEKGGQAALATCSPEGLSIKGKVSVKGGGPSWAHPVVVGGRLYLRYDTTLYCFDVKAK